MVLEYDVLLQPVAAGSPRKSMGERLGGAKVREHDVKSADFAIWGQQASPNGRIRAQGSALTRNVKDHMARRTCFREQYYTGTRRYISVMEDCRQYQGETMYMFVMVFH